MTPRQMRINRIRLEFKVRNEQSFPSHGDAVLIESDWNLKILEHIYLQQRY